MTSRAVAGGGDLSAARKGRLRGMACRLTTLLEFYAFDSLSRYDPAIVDCSNLDSTCRMTGM